MSRGRKTDLEVVMATLKDVALAPGYNPESVQMLMEGLPHAVGTVGGIHNYQRGFLSLVFAYLAAALEAAKAASEALAVKVKEAEATVAVAEVAVSEAREAVEEKRREHSEKTQSRESCQATAKQADVYYKALARSREAIQNARSGTLRRRGASLAAGEALQKFDSGELQESPAEQVLAVLREEQAEQALMTAAPHALKVKPSARGYFDGIVVKEAVSFLERVTTATTEQLETSKEEAADAEVEALGAWAVLDVAHERCAVAEAVLVGAEHALRRQEAAEEQAKANLQGCKAALSQCLVHQTLGEVKVKDLNLAVSALERCTAALDGQEPKAAQEEPEAAPAQKLVAEAESASKDVVMAPVDEEARASTEGHTST